MRSPAPNVPALGALAVGLAAFGPTSAWVPAAAQEPAQEPEPLRVVVVVTSGVAPNMADAVAEAVGLDIDVIKGVEVLDWPSVFRRASEARGFDTDRVEPSCIVALQLARPEGIGAVLCGEISRGREGLEVSGRVTVFADQTVIEAAGFEEQEQAVAHLAGAFRRWLSARRQSHTLDASGGRM